MWRKKGLWASLLALPLAIGGAVYGVSVKVAQPKQAAAYTCPLTGEELPCPNCCPLKAKR